MGMTERRALETLQKEQDLVNQELRKTAQQLDEFSDLKRKEEQLYAEIIEDSAPEERAFFTTKAESSRYFADKSQRELAEKQETLKKKKNLLNDEYDEAERMSKQPNEQKEEGD